MTSYAQPRACQNLLESMASNADGEDESDPYGAEDNSSSHSGEDTDNGPGESNGEAGSGSESSVSPLEELPRTRKSRKRQRTPDDWKKNKRKCRRNTGKRYRSTAHKVVSIQVNKPRIGGGCVYFSNQNSRPGELHKFRVDRKYYLAPVVQ